MNLIQRSFRADLFLVFLLVFISGCITMPGSKKTAGNPDKITGPTELDSSQKTDNNKTAGNLNNTTDSTDPEPSQKTDSNQTVGNPDKITEPTEPDTSSDSEGSTGEVRVGKFFLSPGDRIKISVYTHDDLTSEITIPPGGEFFFPIVGEIDSSGKSLKELRNIITKGLSEYEESFLLPGDEISIAVFNNSELSRNIIIPPDGEIFYPLVGEIDIKNKSIREVRNLITNGLLKHKKKYLMPGDGIFITVYGNEAINRSITISPGGNIFFPFVGKINVSDKSQEDLRELITKRLSAYKRKSLQPGDELSITVYLHEELNRAFAIPSDEIVFYPLVGEIKTNGMSTNKLRRIIAKKLSESIKDVQVGVDLISSTAPTAFFSPQVSVDLISSSVPTQFANNPQVSIDITNQKRPKKIIDPQVTIEVVELGGQKVFILGEVKHPGVVLADGAMRVVEAVTKSGGLTLDAKEQNVLIVRFVENKPKPELIVVDLREAFNAGSMANNPVLEKGDIVYVPRAFIANVDRFFGHLATILSPLLSLEYGYYIGDLLINGRGGGGGGGGGGASISR